MRFPSIRVHLPDLRPSAFFPELSQRISQLLITAELCGVEWALLGTAAFLAILLAAVQIFGAAITPESLGVRTAP